MLANTKGRFDAGSLTHQRGQGLCALVTKPGSENALQTLLCSKGKSWGILISTCFFVQQEGDDVAVQRKMKIV